MSFDLCGALKALGEAVRSGFSFAERCKVEQVNTEFIHDKEDLEDANQQAVRALLIAYKYQDKMKTKDRFFFRKYYNKFMNLK